MTEAAVARSEGDAKGNLWRLIAGNLPEIGATDALLLAFWIGTISGLTEGAIAYIRNELKHLPTGEAATGEVFWMAPLAAVVSLGAIAVVLIVLDRVLRARGALVRLAPPLFVGIIIFGLVRALHFGIVSFALAILALGCGVLVARATPAHVTRLRRVMRVTAPWMLAGLVAWGIAVPLQRRALERRALAKLPVASPGSPNVLILIWDAARALNLSLYGYARKTTPELEHLGSQGMVFERAFATAPWSLPSHASMLTGRYPHEMSAGPQKPLDESYRSLAEVLAERGYSTGGFTANLFYGASSFGLARGFSWYDARPAIDTMVIAQKYWLTRTVALWLRELQGNRQELQRRPASDVNDAVTGWIARRGQRPFFAFVNHFDAHQPYLPPAPFNRAFTKTGTRYWIDDDPRTYTADTLQQLTDAYDGGLQYLDSELGHLLAKLREMGVLENTMVIVTADHGEEFGEHGPGVVGHQRSLYSPVLLVPLVIVFPAHISPGVRRSEPVSIRDIPATVVEALGLKEENPFPGNSLMQYASGAAAPDASSPQLSEVERHPLARQWAAWPASTGDMFSVAAANYHYILDGEGVERLYDLTDDVWERKNLADSPAMAERLQTFRATLDSLVPAEGGVRRARKRSAKQPDAQPAKGVTPTRR